MPIHLERWKSLLNRYQDDRPRRLLALDGGGVRGLITLGILQKIEVMIREKAGLSLCEYFDYIGGTSTGAIIAASLARGMTTADLIKFYQSYGREMFDPAALLERYKYLHTADPLIQQLKVMRSSLPSGLVTTISWWSSVSDCSIFMVRAFGGGPRNLLFSRFAFQTPVKSIMEFFSPSLAGEKVGEEGRSPFFLRKSPAPQVFRGCLLAGKAL